VNPYSPGLFFVGRLFTVSKSLLVRDLFEWFTCFWFNFNRSNASRNLSISSGIPSLLEYKFSKCYLMILGISLIVVVISPFSYLILLIWLLTLLLLVTLGKDFFNLIYPFKEPPFCFVDPFFFFFFLSPFD
jgi:hypothetical protein